MKLKAEHFLWTLSVFLLLINMGELYIMATLNTKYNAVHDALAVETRRTAELAEEASKNRCASPHCAQRGQHMHRSPCARSAHVARVARARAQRSRLRASARRTAGGCPAVPPVPNIPTVASAPGRLTTEPDRTLHRGTREWGLLVDAHHEVSVMIVCPIVQSCLQSLIA